jgi:hypothetical protein
LEQDSTSDLEQKFQENEEIVQESVQEKKTLYRQMIENYRNLERISIDVSFAGYTLYHIPRKEDY